jgi:hypothetical protein
MRITNFTKQLSIFLLIFSVLSNSGTFGQKVATAKKAAATPKCSGVMTGTIKYTRTQSLTDNKTVQRVSGRGTDKTDFHMAYEYNALVALTEDPSKGVGGSKAIANIDQKMSSTETVVANESNSCDRGKSWQNMSGTSTSKSETTGHERAEANATIGWSEDGTYVVSVALPQIKGQVTGSTDTTFSGQCTAKEGKTSNLPATPTTIDGNSLTSDGTNRVDPADPYKLSGSYSKTWQNVTETITWNLQKCGAPLRLTDLKFEHPKFPDFDKWEEITEQVGTIDGNMVKIKATVLNASGETKSGKVKLVGTYKGDKWDGAKPDEKLGDDEVDVSLDAGEAVEVEMVWDSSGYAWYDDGRPRLVQRIKAELEENNKKVDDLTKNLKVAPKPILLVQDLWSNWRIFETWQNILTTSHSYDWKAFPVGEVREKGHINTGGPTLSTVKPNSVEQNAGALASYIKYAQEDRNAWHVDIVGYGLGGVIARSYISRLMPVGSPDGRPKVSHMLMLGTANEGTKCADIVETGLGMFSDHIAALKMLRTSTMADFNRMNSERKGVKMAVLAGNPLPSICYALDWNDGNVTVPSAFHNFTDRATTKSLHRDLTGTSDFSAFVKPHLAIGPKGNHMPDLPTTAQTGSELYRGESLFTNVSYQTGGEVKPDIFFGNGASIAPGQTVEMEIHIPAGTDGFGLTFIASRLVSATLLDAAGNVIGENVKDTPESNSLFRSIVVLKDLSGTTVKLRFLNEEQLEQTTVVSGWKK